MQGLRDERSTVMPMKWEDGGVSEGSGEIVMPWFLRRSVA
jgi:hypothetical protein